MVVVRYQLAFSTLILNLIVINTYQICIYLSEFYWIKWQRECWENDGFSNTRWLATNSLSKIRLFLSAISHPLVLVYIISLYTCPLKYHVAHVHILLHSSTIISPLHLAAFIFSTHNSVTKYSSPLAHHLFFYNTCVKGPTEIKSR